MARLRQPGIAFRFVVDQGRSEIAARPNTLGAKVPVGRPRIFPVHQRFLLCLSKPRGENALVASNGGLLTELAWKGLAFSGGFARETPCDKKKQHLPPYFHGWERREEKVDCVAKRKEGWMGGGVQADKNPCVKRPIS
jgi:hypothetical protein